jgi:radical SAM superfamily enzyme YgiQ (UPF0313 family)
MKICLIAISGVRVCDEKLLEVGLTLPGFVERSKVIASLPSLGLLTLAGMLSAQHSVEYLEVADPEEYLPDNESFSGFDLVAISSYSAQIKDAYRLADLIRDFGVPVVFGGLHVSILPKEAKEHCDSVVIGEGESSWPTLVADAEKGDLQPFYGTVESEFDLQNAPMPAFELLDIEKYNRLTIQTSRGCPHRCEFCASSILLTNHYKQKPAEKVLAELDKIKGIWEHPFIEFADDNTFVNKSYWHALLPEIKQRKIRWFTETDISISSDAKLLKLMRESGCAQVLIGFESPSRSGLTGIESRTDWKAKQLDTYVDAIKNIQSHGISVNGCFVLGLDDHGPEIFDEVFNFVKDSGLHEVQVTIQTAFPGTMLYKRLKQQNRIIDDNAWEKCTLFDVNFIPVKMTPDELAVEFRKLVEKLYSDEFTKLRQSRFRENMRNISRS